MLPSEKLRLLISKTYNIDLEKYAWPEELKNTIFSTPLDKDLETNANTLGEIYEHGFNIGHCGLTSRYVCRKFNNALLHYGTSSLLIGTKNSPNGEHAWTTINDVLIDTTLMICFPIDKATDLGYKLDRTISRESATLLSEYDLFDNDFNEFNKNPDFSEKIFNITR